MASPSPALDIFISGDGIVGRSLALLLAREKLRVGLSAAQPVPPGAPADIRAYALTPASRALLESIRAWPEDETLATPVLAMQVHGDEGSELNFSAALHGTPALNWIVDAPVLEEGLATALRYQPQIERVAHGQEPNAPLTVVCEGRASATRAALGVDYEMAPYAQHALAARVRCEQPHGQVARQWFLREASAGEVLALLPLGGPQGDTVAVVWSVSPQRAAFLQDLTPKAYAEALALACGHALGAMQLVSERRAWPLVRAQARHWSGRTGQDAWVLAGDAAHAVHPLAGQGLNLGLADVAELARVLRKREDWRGVADPKLLRRYERARKAGMLPLDLGMDALQRLYTREGPFWNQLRAWGLRGVEHSGWLKHWLARQAMGA
ncbi:FAD-dependent monooxygenase [Hylemonella gracilis]|uniref:Ubiquinone biosynthesis hydroxylase, ubih/ubif/visc/coq6 family protein n=1 Tax=Hylemonella gracilis ATCC 19624 TaxID=887062 RepID=F3KUA6_9BURK|nr:FAD-dependent monooxygenase [Hylemonella gracilis]EGI76656.1 ubiquinone biosynthesis hydroxylase, ubih/ubif/visc/coq6 family protein [Hylemonella gracilis ATCC 19624]